MYAVVKTGGKQYRVSPGDILRVEKLDGEPGSTILIKEVLLVGDGDKVTPGTPLVEGLAVKAEILEQARAPKVIVFKKKRRHNYRRKRGHRQHLTVLKVLEIGDHDKLSADKPAAKAKTKKPASTKAEKQAPAAEKAGADKSAEKKGAAGTKAAAGKARTTKTKGAAAKKTAGAKKAAPSKGAEKA